VCLRQIIPHYSVTYLWSQPRRQNSANSGKVEAVERHLVISMVEICLSLFARQYESDGKESQRSQKTWTNLYVTSLYSNVNGLGKNIPIFMQTERTKCFSWAPMTKSYTWLDEFKVCPFRDVYTTSRILGTIRTGISSQQNRTSPYAKHLFHFSPLFFTRDNLSDILVTHVSFDPRFREDLEQTTLILGNVFWTIASGNEERWG
jgi:hypothetical protein